MSFWTGFAGGLQAGARIRDGWDERGGLSGIFGSGAETQEGDKPMSDFSAAQDGSGVAAAPSGGSRSSGSGGGGNARPFQTSDPVADDIPAEGRAFLNTIAGGESGGRYDVRWGGPQGPQSFQLNGQHPGIMAPGPHGPSSAAGRYQITRTTYRGMGGGDFSPRAQDHMAWNLAQRDYRANTGRDLLGDLQSRGVTRDMLSSLKGTWAAFGTNTDRHIATFQDSMRRYQSGGAAPAATASGRNRAFTTDGEIDPIRVMPGEIEIPSLFDNQVRPDAGQQVRESGEIEQLAASARRAAPGLAVTETASRPRALRAGEADSASDPQLIEGAPPAPITSSTFPDIQSAAVARGGVTSGAAARGSAEAPPARMLRPGEVDSATSPQMPGEPPPPAPIRGETAELEARAYARGGVGDGPGGRAAVSAVRDAPGLGVQARAVAPRALAAGEVDSATDPQMAPSPTGTGTAAGHAGGGIGARASVSAPVGSGAVQERDQPAAPASPAAAPARSATPAPASAPTPPARPQPAAAPAAAPRRDTLSERERLMMLRDPSSLAPGEEERLRAGLPQNTMRMPDLMSLFRGRGTPAPTRERSAERVRPAAPAPAPAAAAPATTGSVPAAPVRVEPSRAPVGPSGNVQEGDQPAAAPPPAATAPAPAPAPAQRAPDPVPYPEPRNDQERFANGRAAALAALDRGEPPEQVAQGLEAAGVPVEEWPRSLRQVQTAARRGPVYDARGQLLPAQGGLSGAAAAQAMRTGRAPGIVMR